MRISPQAALCGALATLLALLFLTPAVSAAGLKCEEVWTGPSKDNDPLLCLSSSERAQKAYAIYIPAAVMAIMLVLGILFFPVAFLWCVCCQCCCKCCKDVPPGEREQSRPSRRKLSGCLVIGVMMGLAVFALLLVGATSVKPAVDKVYTNVELYITDFFVSLSADLRAAAVDPNNSSNFVPPFTEETFTEIDKQIKTVTDAFENPKPQVESIANTISTVAFALSAVPLVIYLLTTVPCCLCSCRRVLPSLCTCLHWLLYILFALIAFVILVLAGVLSDVDSEFQNQKSRKPGLGQWYLVPYCEATANFTQQKQSILDVETDLSQKGCTELLKYCADRQVYNISDPNRVFRCALTNASQCQTVENVRSAVDSAVVMLGAPPVCTEVNCTIRQCVDNCTQANLRDAARTAIDNLNLATQLKTVLGILLPHMDCNAIIDRLFNSAQGFVDIKKTLFYVGAGFFISVFVSLCAWIVLFLGAKLWFDEQEYQEKGEEPVDAFPEDPIGQASPMKPVN